MKKSKPYAIPFIIIVMAIILLAGASIIALHYMELASLPEQEAPEAEEEDKLKKDTVRENLPQNDKPDKPSPPSINYDPEDVDVEKLVEKMNFLENPLPGTTLSWNDAHLPGAERPYRNGIHHGLDFYAEESGADISTGTPVFAAASGELVRVDKDYEFPTNEELIQLSRKCQELGKTPEEILDVFRGRQVWVENEKGFIIRYCHLDDVAENLEKGEHVRVGDEIGTMGYSGTTEVDRPHLHLEIWFDDNYLGEGMSNEEIREFFQATIFNNNSS